ncbi:hypothetical protein [Actibacterium sp. XHP0104]|uniref:hypothetical protein n=1 Tax=Actibacterium sp. XHP0104 TaxID=2984335 RepID=UPI0021E8BFCC|nr:hypothetical protein [Actibacterium sp. XHP0104]MCV2880847.1 hypothetical protein [Actibacterium sp. XHP0104]
MSDINDFEHRITAALERIGKGIATIAPGGAGGDQVAQLTAALADEKNANAQLEERVRAIQEKQDKHLAQLEARLTKLSARAEAAEREIDRMRRVNAELRASNAALREANAGGLGDDSLINQAMQAELDALRAVRDSDRAELDQILAELTPLVQGETHA